MMKNIITFFNWRTEFENNIADADSIDNDFILLDNPIILPTFDYPFKVDAAVAIICITGTTSGKINLKPYTISSPGLIILLPEQILQNEYISEDFSGLFIVMSRRFTDSLNIQEKLPLFFAVRDHPFIPLTAEEVESMVDYFSMMQKAIRVKDNPYRMEVAKHLTKAFFYGVGYSFHKISKDENKTKREILVGFFLDQVQAHYKKERGVEFYAGKLCLTPKYLSKVVKESSGMSASKWIDNYVVLEAKALLKSTNMTIQQISDELNFPSQSFFGKYFKRLVGVSPKEYRRNG